MNEKRQVDCLVLGAGAAGLFVASRVGTHGRSVLVVDHAKRPADKVRISGGGRCNFTNMETEPKRFISENPHFAKSALARYTPWDFTSLMAEHGLTWTEKTLGQLFCDQKSGAVIQMLLDELSKVHGELWLETDIADVAKTEDGFRVATSRGEVQARTVVVATGGLSIPKMGATGFAYDLARQFGLRIVEPRPALVPFTFTGGLKDEFAALAGLACPVRARAQGPAFDEAMLFTHRGLSGPALLQISSYWDSGADISLDLISPLGGRGEIMALRDSGAKKQFGSVLESLFPKRLVEYMAHKGWLKVDQQMGQVGNAVLNALADQLSDWRIKPAGTEGWRTAEVTVGGVSTADLSSKTMECATVPGLYFIGECVDVTGWLGGYNFQWAWASAAAAAEAIGQNFQARLSG